MCSEKCLISKHSFYSESSCGKAKEKLFSKTILQINVLGLVFRGLPLHYGVTTGCIFPSGHNALLPSEFKLRYFKNLKLFSIRIESKIIILAYSFAEKKATCFLLLF